MIRGLYEAHLPVSNLQESIKFYKNLGLELFQQPQTILFTNVATINGTIERLKQFASNRKKSIDIEILVINNTFDLIMKGLKDEYNQEIIKFLHTMIQQNKNISVAQLSMVDASKKVQQLTSKTIINPLDTLISYILNQLKIDNNTSPF